jgi:hypothetical protein
MISYITGDIFTFRPSRQTLRAWEPFWDCVGILFEFQNSDIDDEHPEWRLHWVAGIALLRTIGHVLVKADAETSYLHQEAVDRLWEIWKSNRVNNEIFWNFVETERNNLLKTYTFGATLVNEKGGFCVRYSNGDDALQLYREAVYWWRHQLNELEKYLS